MKLKPTIWILISLVFVMSCAKKEDPLQEATNAFEDVELQKIYSLSDLRKTEELLPYATHETAAYRMAFARTVASNNDSIFKPFLIDLIKDPIPYVRLYSAFAIGQYRDTTFLPSLEKAIKKATIPEIKSEVLIAIGKCSNDLAMDYLIFHEPSTSIEEAGKIWAIYYGTLAGNLKEEHLRIVIAHLNSQEEETRLAAAHILSRQRAFSLDTYGKQIIDAINEEKIGEIRAALTKSLYRTTDSTSEFVKLALTDPDPRVRSAAIGGIKSPFDLKSSTAILEALEDGSPWVSMTAASRLNDLELNQSQVQEIAFLMQGSNVPEVNGAIAALMIDKKYFDEEAWEYWRSLENTSAEKLAIVKSLNKTASAQDSLRLYALTDNAFGTITFEKLTEWELADSILGKSWFDIANASLEKGLLSQAYIACNAMLEVDQLQYLDTTALINSKKYFIAEGKAETRNRINDLLTKLGIPNQQSNTIERKKLDWDFICNIPKRTSASIYTSNGTYEIALLVEDAPGSVSNFIKLAENRFYDSTNFHRIVPAFVSQGGGPRGDGYGNTSYNIRSEFSNLHYGPGVVGLASAGKDTEGCQFFITQMSTPHLNGRYTIIGALSSGFENLDQIKTGTRIDSIVVDIDVN